MALSTLVRRQQGMTGSAIDLLNKMYRSKRVLPPRKASDWFRVSSIGGLCPREEVLCARHNLTREEAIEGIAGLNFDMGNGVHWMLQNRAMGGTGLLLGRWRCTYCGEWYGSRATKMMPRPDRCSKCGAPGGEPERAQGRPVEGTRGNAFLYVEEFIGSDEWRIGGHPDGQMTFGNPLDYVLDDITLLEFKSCNENNYRNYKTGPDPVHVIQVQVYMWLTGYPRAKIVYLNKNGRGTDGMTEHDLVYDIEVIDRVKSAVQQIRTGIDDGSVPERTVCAHRDCNRAFKCRARDLCFV